MFLSTHSRLQEGFQKFPLLAFKNILHTLCRYRARTISIFHKRGSPPSSRTSRCSRACPRTRGCRCRCRSWWMEGRVVSDSVGSAKSNHPWKVIPKYTMANINPHFQLKDISRAQSLEGATFLFLYLVTVHNASIYACSKVPQEAGAQSLYDMDFLNYFPYCCCRNLWVLKLCQYWHRFLILI